VGANSMLGAVFHHRHGNLNWRVALIFGSSGMLVAYLSSGLSKLIAPAVLLVVFALLMLFIAGLMLFRKEKKQEQAQAVDAYNVRGWPVVLAGGVGVGFLTGLLGVGGGFLIVPALVMLVGLPMYQAVGTSLIIISANSLAGLAGHMRGEWFDPTLTTIFVVAGLGGTFVGVRLAQYLPAGRLRQIFAVFIIILGIFLLADNLPKV
jgi:uncharacterized protein